MKRLVVNMLVIVFALFVFARMIAPSADAPAPRSKTQAMALNVDSDGRSGFAGDETVIERDASGQFHLKARVNGEDAEFLVDTGADIVALTEDDAERLGMPVAPEDFRPIMQTASGVGNGAKVRIERLELGDEEFHDLGAVVVQGLEVNLLGQSVLRRLGKVELQGDRMVIEHR